MASDVRLCRRLRAATIQNARQFYAVDLVYLVILVYLIVYSILNGIYLMREPANPSVGEEPHNYDITNVSVQPVSCAFSASSQYQRTSRLICYLLLIVTIVIRNHDWLAVGAAASVMTYSGVTAFHMIVLFATNNRFALSPAKTRCNTIAVPSSSTPFLACEGVWDTDGGSTFVIVSTCLLAALPIAAWSTTFRSSRSKPILLAWLLLLAVAHIFFNITATDVTRHFQICPLGRIESLPLGDYQAPEYDDAWRRQFLALVNSNKSSVSPGHNGKVAAMTASASGDVCIYSCFATSAYTGRVSQNIGVYDIIIADFGPRLRQQQRFLGILLWSVYTFLAVLTLLTTEKKNLLPKWVHRNHTIKMSWLVTMTRRRAFSSSNLRLKKQSMRKSERHVIRDLFRRCADLVSDVQVARVVRDVYHDGRLQVSILNIVQIFTQSLGLAAFLGSVILDENKSYLYAQTEVEPFSAVGQWGNVVVVVLVLLAAGISRLWGNDKGTPSVDQVERVDCRDVEEEEMEQEEGWNCEIGYAS